MEIRFAIEKDVKWDAIKQKSITTYWVKANGEYLALAESEEKALELFEVAKQNYQPPVKSILIKEETIEL
jgi:hypothetical protein